MPYNPTPRELARQFRQIPSYPDYEVTIIGKVRDKETQTLVDPFMIDGQENKGIHVKLTVQGFDETIDVGSLVNDAFHN